MASVFRKKYRDRKTGEQKSYPRHTVQFRDHAGIVRRVQGFKEAGLSKDLGKKLDKLCVQRQLEQSPDKEIAGWLQSIPPELKELLAKWEILQSEYASGGRRLADHLEDYREFLTAKENTEDHVKQTISRLTTSFTGCGFIFPGDIDADHFHNWLAQQRATGMSIQTSNYYLTAAKSFGKWMIQVRRFVANPFSVLKGLNAKADRRRERRVLSADDLGRLIVAARQSELVFRGLTGEDRSVLYITASRTGLRAAELASLTRGSLRLDAEFPCVALKASDEKARRGAMLPLSPDVVEVLRAWLRERDRQRGDVISLAGVRDEKLWPGTWNEKAAKMIRKDLAAAREAWIDEAGDIPERANREQSDRLEFADHDGRVFDFHSLRGQFITDLGRAGVPLTTAQKLARHSDPNLTANLYTHLQSADLASAVGQLSAPSQSAGTPAGTSQVRNNG